MARKIINTALILLASLLPLKSQTGGDNVYEFLNLTYSSLISSLGGVNVSLNNGDLNMAYSNPALLSEEMNKSLVLNYVNYFAGINYGMTMYSMSFPGAGKFATGLTYLNYGTFKEADESGNITGSFSAAEYAFSVLWSKSIDTLFSIGISLKPVISHLEKYTSFGIAFDLGVSWHAVNNLTSAGLVLRNAGFQIISYTGETREKLPFEIQAGVSHRLAHAPLRFSVTLRHLEKFDLTYTYNEDTNSSLAEQSGFAENILRHVIVGAEVIPHKNFYFSAGYNYQRRRELHIESNMSAAGFSWGFGINTTFLSVGFGRATFHLAGASNHFTLTVKPDLLYRKFRN
ncbi:MAG: type IX secretion system protein PorQ [Bacteroidales bacterium]